MNRIEMVPDLNGVELAQVGRLIDYFRTDSFFDELRKMRVDLNVYIWREQL